ncbi:MAG: iron ABC transporter permease [Crenarchaeota archaeon]|nr:iron ABC transporter permease [Thermoproteota archaeon]
MKSRHIILFSILLLSLIPTFLICVCVGPEYIPPLKVLSILYSGIVGNNHSSTVFYDIVWRIRVPRVIASFIAGAALSISGLLLQILFRNPIVGPWVLGVESGSVLAVGLLILAGALVVPGGVTSPWALFAASLIGALAVMFIVLILAGVVRSIVTLLLIGVTIGYLCSAMLSILEALATKIQLQAFVMWSLGSLGAVTWSQIKVMTLVFIPCLVLSIICGKGLNAYILGEEHAKTLGVNVRIVRIMVILVSSILTAVITAFAGPIAFIGLAVPHIARLLYRTADSRILIPASAIIGAVVTAYCDLASRMMLAPVELPISTTTSLFGAPILIMLLTRRRS